MKDYLTLERAACAEFVERRSRFIGYCKPIVREEEATAFISEIKSKHWDASHNVYAYVLREGQIRRYSDDGEPQGTAGIPVLEVLQKSGLTDAVVVVTRYFGGVLLGAGGLVRAYSHGAKLAVEAGGMVQMRLCAELSLHCDYTQYGKISALIPAEGGVIDDTIFTDRVELCFHLPESEVEDMEKKLADSTSGTVKTVEKSKNFYSFQDFYEK